MSTNPFDDDNGTFFVLVNAEEPARFPRREPAGWLSQQSPNSGLLHRLRTD
jgi:uncharacterized protein YbdZ (MbtH family)